MAKSTKSSHFLAIFVVLTLFLSITLLYIFATTSPYEHRQIAPNNRRGFGYVPTQPGQLAQPARAEE